MPTMSIYQKLACIRREVREQGLKKSGLNMHAEFAYWELADFVPAAAAVMEKYNTIFLTDFYGDMAVGTLVDFDSDKTIVFRFPFRQISEPAKFRMNEAQARGAEITYFTRYLYYMLLSITNKDELDAVVEPVKPEPAKQEAPKPAEKKSKKPVTKEQRAEIKQELTAADEPATQMQMDALRNALNALLDKDPDQEFFVQQIAQETNGLLDITKSRAEELIFYLGKIMESYTDA